jgi:outer membrane protein TolC
VAAIEGRAGLLQGQQAVLTAELQLSDMTTEMNDLLGLPLDTQLVLDPAVPANVDLHSYDEFVQIAWAENPDIRASEDTVQKAKAAVAAAQTAYIPDVTAYARQSYQNGVPFLVHNFGEFGVHVSWEIFDFGKRRAAARERQTQLAEAEETWAGLRTKSQLLFSVDITRWNRRGAWFRLRTKSSSSDRKVNVWPKIRETKA